MDHPIIYLADNILDHVATLTAELKRCRPYIEAALKHAGGTHTYEDVCIMVLQNRARLWPLPNGCIITEILDYPRERHYHMWLGGGDLQEILAMHEVVQQAAMEAGCCKLTVAGRRGWVRTLKEYGWDEYLTTMAKRIT